MRNEGDVSRILREPFILPHPLFNLRNAPLKKANLIMMIGHIEMDSVDLAHPFLRLKLE